MKLLVVDDDRYTREGILTSLPMEELGISNVMQTHDGKTALEITRWFCPDIIITDICMPRMDGMAFAVAVRKLQPECLIIFITGFAEISYLKQAIELSAVAFVEKPLQSEELMHAVQSAIVRYQERQSADQRQESLLKLRRQQAAAIMMRTHKDLQELYRLCDEIAFPQNALYRCLAIRVGQQNPHIAMEIIEKIASAHGFICVSELREDRCIHVVLAGKRRGENRFPALTEEILNQLTGVVIGEGSVANELEQVHESRKSACMMLERAFFDTNRQYFSGQWRGGSGVLSVDVYAKFAQLLEENRELLPDWLDHLLADVIAAQADRVESVRMLMLSILRALYQRYPELYGKVYGISQPAELDEFVYAVTSAKQYREMLGSLFEVLHALEDASSRFAQVVRDAKSYILKHIHEPELGLKEIAAQVNFSAAYLNVVFRTETGMTVKQYLIDCRIREAKRLLRDPNVRISEIAQRCGYSNANYFAKAFKETTGLTPGEYREQKV